MNDLTPQERCAVDAFDRAWQVWCNLPRPHTVPLPELGTALLRAPSPTLFRALLVKELWYRLHAGRPPTLSEYQQRFPRYAKAALQVFRQPILLEPLGGGAMGVVYKAWDPLLGRAMALKRIRAGEVPEPEQRARFLDEARAVARLQHPNVVQIYEVGEQEGQPYLCLEFVGGGTLAAKIGRRPQPPRYAAAVVQALARAIHTAHGQGIVHRDLKPANVLLDPSGTPKVTDFGLAKFLDDETGQTRSGAILGTPAYMAPEQAAGKTRAIGPLTDVYALGAILYELLTGRPPFGGENVRAVLDDVCRREPIPPSRRQPDVPLDMETICLKCLQKEPERRYGSAEELADDLRRWLGGEPIRARPVGRLERWRSWARRNPLPARLGAAVAALVVIVVVGGLAALVFGRRVSEWAEAKGGEAAREREEGLRQRLQALQTEADELLAKARESATAAEGLGAIDAAVALRGKGADILHQLGDPDAERAEHERLWGPRWVALRDEASRWLTRLRLRKQQSIALPVLPAASQFEAAATPDGARVVVVYLTAAELLVVHRDSGIVRRVPLSALPRDTAVSGRAARLAISPDGSRIALLVSSITSGLSPGGTEVLLLDGSGQLLHRRPARLPFGTTLAGQDEMRLTADGLLVFDHYPFTPASRWSLRPTAEEWQPTSREIRLDPPRPSLPFGGAVAGAGTRYLAEYDPATTAVRVRPVGTDGPGQAVWFGAAAEPCRRVRFGDDPAVLFLLTGRRLVLIDADTGSRAETALADLPFRELLAIAGGAVTVEGVPGRPVQVTFWKATAAAAPTRALAHPGAVRAVDLAADGLLITAGQDGQARAWRDHQPAVAFGEAPAASVPLTPFTPEGRPAHGPFAWWGFLPGGEHHLVVERVERTKGEHLSLLGASAVRTEVYRAADGRLLHSFPANGAGRILRLNHSWRFHQVGPGFAPPSLGPRPAMTADRRHAVVVAKERPGGAELELWSLEGPRALGRLGEYELTADAVRAQFNPGVSAHFSPSGRWLLLVRHPEFRTTAAEVEVWRVPEAHSTGKFSVPSWEFRCVFSPDETRVLLTGAGGLVRSFGRAAELSAPAGACDLEKFDATDAPAEGLRFAGDIVVAPRVDRSPHAIPGMVQPPRPPCAAWDLRTGKRTDLGGAWAVGPLVEVSPDGERALLVGSLKEQPQTGGKLDMQFWDLTAGKLLCERKVDTDANAFPTTHLLSLGSHGPPLLAGDREHAYLRLSPLGRTAKRAVGVWKWSDGSAAETVNGDLVAADPGRGWLMWRSDRGLTLCRVASGERVALEETASSDAAPQFAPGGRSLFLPAQRVVRMGRGPEPGSGGGLWEANTGRRLVALPVGHHFSAFDPTGRWAVSAEPSAAEVRVWDCTTGAEAHRLKLALTLDPAPSVQVIGVPARKLYVEVSPSGDRLALPLQGLLHLWDAAGNRSVEAVRRPGHSGPLFAVAQHTGAGLVATAGEEGVVNLWGRGDGRLIHHLTGHTQRVLALAFRPDGAAVASAGSDGRVILWQADGGRTWTYQDDRPGTVIRCLAFQPRGTLLAAGTGDGRLLLLDTRRGERQAALVAGSPVQAVAFSPGGTRLAAGTGKGTVLVWPADRLVPAAAPKTWDSGSPVAALSFSRAGEWLVTGGQTLRIWDAETGRALWSLETVSGPVQSLAVSPEGTILAAADQSDRVTWFDLAALNKRLAARGLGVPGWNAEVRRQKAE